MSDSVGSWLADHELAEYAPLFHDNKIDMSILTELPATLKKALRRHNVPGASVALLRNGRIKHVTVKLSEMPDDEVRVSKKPAKKGEHAGKLGVTVEDLHVPRRPDRRNSPDRHAPPLHPGLLPLERTRRAGLGR